MPCVWQTMGTKRNKQSGTKSMGKQYVKQTIRKKQINKSFILGIFQCIERNVLFLTCSAFFYSIN